MPTLKKQLDEVLNKIDQKNAELAALKPLAYDQEERLWKKFRLEWNYNSNHIEGNTLTYQETELYLIFDQTPTNPHTGRELEEMKAHDVAVELIRQWASDPNRQLTEADIRELNKTILVRPFWKDAETSDGQKTRRQIQIGEYKQHPNHVRLPNNEIFRYAEPADVPQKMGELLEWYRTEGSNLHPIITAALLHYRFVRIHPFDDGNGRISRLLLNYHLLRNNLPPLVIKSADKQNYLFALQKADVGDLDAFCIYVAEQLLWSLDLSIKAAKGESIEEIGDWEKEVNLLKRYLENEKQHTNHRKKDLKTATVYWLEKNIPILVKVMEQRVGVFSTFFSQSTFKTIGRTKGGSELDIVANKIEWKDFVIGMYDNVYSSRISLEYEFKDFLYKPTKIAIEKSPRIDIYIDDDSIRIDNSLQSGINSKIKVWDDLKEDDLKPVVDLGNIYFQIIKDAKEQ
ncbi:MAG: Fic family protein [Saprospiraceae bacterium]